jgi:nicotinamidase-related amidase
MRLPDDAVLILVDVQKGFDDPSWGRRNNPLAERNMAKLLEHWRATGRPVVHFQHQSARVDSPLHPASPGCVIKEIVRPAPGEPIFPKSVHSCFIGTGLAEWLRERGHRTLVIVGLTTPHCVSTTARMAGDLGYRPYVVADATAAFEATGPDGQRHAAEEVHALSLAALHDEFATVLGTADLLEPEGLPEPMSRPPIACRLAALDAGQRARRQELWEKLRPLIRESREVAGGYAFRLDTAPATLVQIAEFISLERACCPFFNFQLEIVEENGPTWWRVTGREGVKEFLAQTLGVADPGA